ncbi:MAG: hypothetical protein KKC23_09510, partial [Proteobacteria bacterium]|nr:hypothetical protein [Pseudomonadota bacterium]
MKCGQCGCSITAEKQKDYIYYHCIKKNMNLKNLIINLKNIKVIKSMKNTYILTMKSTKST